MRAAGRTKFTAVLLLSLSVTALLFAAGIILPGQALAAENPGEEIYFTILHTNDEHATIIPHSPAVDFHPVLPDPTVGGFARLATAVNEIRREKEAAGEPVLLLSGGDFMGGTPFSWLAPLGFAPELALMQAIGYDAVTFGNHEFDYGTEVLATYLLAAGYPADHERTVVLAGNALAPADHPLAAQELYRRWHLLELENGLKVGLFSLIGPDALAVANSPEPLEFTDPLEAAWEIVGELQEQGADVIVALTHSGLQGDVILAREVPGLHVIVGGHCHTALEEPVEENGVLIVQTGSLLQYLGRLELAYNPATGQVRARNREHNQPFLLPLDDRYGQDEDIAVQVDLFTRELNKLVERLTGGRFLHILDTAAVSDFPLSIEPPFQETPFGNFIADAMRLVTSERLGARVDVAVQANGNIRAGVIPGSLEHARGKISFYDLADSVGLGIGPDGYAGYPVASFYLTGEELRRALEVAVLLPELFGDIFFLQFSGLRYEYDPDNAVLFTIPGLNQPVPTALLPGKLGAVTRAEIYTGEGRQTDNDDDYQPLRRGDSRLYHVVTDIYILSFLPLVGEMLPALNLELKDARGLPVPQERLDDLIVRIDGRELKVWQTVVEYAAAQPLNEDGLPQVDPYYSAAAGRIMAVDAFPVIAWPILALLLVVLLLFILVRLLLRRRRRRKARFARKIEETGAEG